MVDERDGFVTLIDEDGKEIEFEHLDTIELNDKEYVILAPVADDSAEDDDVSEIVILRVSTDENGEETLVSVDDEKELDEVFNEFKSLYEEDFDFEE